MVESQRTKAKEPEKEQKGYIQKKKKKNTDEESISYKSSIYDRHMCNYIQLRHIYFIE